MNDELKAKLAATEGHTDEPWVAKRQVTKNGKSLGWIIDHSNGRIGWSSYATAEPNAGECSPHTQGGINAHLIALAPELKVEVLRQDALIGELVKAMKAVESANTWGRLSRGISFVRTVLAKAKEQS